MNLDLLVTAAATTLGVVVGAASTITLEQLRRRHEARQLRREERKQVYAAFMTSVVQWQNAIAWRAQRKLSQDGQAGTFVADHQMVEQAHQTAMAPLFELRMIGTSTVVEAAEEIMKGVYEYETALDANAPAREELEMKWVQRRDCFIQRARAELEL